MGPNISFSGKRARTKWEASGKQVLGYRTLGMEKTVGGGQNTSEIEAMNVTVNWGGF